jgi:imidazolonepropionase
MSGLLIRNARVLTLSAGPRPRRGAHLNRLNALDRTDVLVLGDRIAAVGHSLSLPPHSRIVEGRGRVLMPGFIDCHTHACFAGSRIEEWQMRLAGKTYLEILQSGGGIMSTVRATRDAAEADLAMSLLARLRSMLRLGTTTMEVKSGYGLTPRDEVKMLRAIDAADREFEGTVIPTALIAHALDPEQPDQVKATLGPTLNSVHEEWPQAAIDAYCEEGAWTLEATMKLFQRAKTLGHRIRVHTDQFNSLGMIAEAVRLGATSCDHLEAATDEDLTTLATSSTVAVGLPCSGFHLDGRYAKLRSVIDQGGAVAIATNFNPGSAPCMSMPTAIALAVRGCGLTPAEAIAACTVNAAHVLGLPDRGTLAPGQRADMILLKHEDERALAYEFGGDPVEAVICAGKLVKGVAEF